MDALIQYDWPGNIRELENVVERALVLSPGSTLVLDEFFARSAGSHHPNDLRRKLEDMERVQILEALEECRWKIKGEGNAADRLGLKPSTLNYRMKKLGIGPPQRLPR